MNRYNAEHYRDDTAAIAIDRADKAHGRYKDDKPRLRYKDTEGIDRYIVGGRIDVRRMGVESDATQIDSKTK